MATLATASDVGTYGASRAMGAGTLPECSSGPHEDDRAGEVQTSSPPTNEGADAADESAPDGATMSSFFFAASGGLTN